MSAIRIKYPMLTCGVPFARFRLDLVTGDRKSSVSTIKRSNKHLFILEASLTCLANFRYSRPREWSLLSRQRRATLLRRWELNCANLDRNPLSTTTRSLFSRNNKPESLCIYVHPMANNHNFKKFFYITLHVWSHYLFINALSGFVNHSVAIQVLFERFCRAWYAGFAILYFYVAKIVVK